MTSALPLATEALTGFADSALYDQHRPSFPSDSVQTLLHGLRVVGKDAARILDLAAGTGKFTELLARRPEKYEVIAVEPHGGMRNELEKKHLTDVTIHSGLSTDIPLSGESVDAVVAAQAFHWFSDHSSLQEIHRVLKPNGAFGMIWNVEDYNQTKAAKPATRWEAKLKQIIWSYDDNRPRYRHEKWRHVFEDQLQSSPVTITLYEDSLFALPLGQDERPWTVWLKNKQAVWDRFSTLSQIAVLKGQEREEIKRQVLEALEGEDVESNEKGEIALHGVTVCAWTTKLTALTGVSKLSFNTRTRQDGGRD